MYIKIEDFAHEITRKLNRRLSNTKLNLKAVSRPFF